MHHSLNTKLITIIALLKQEPTLMVLIMGLITSLLMHYLAHLRTKMWVTWVMKDWKFRYLMKWSMFMNLRAFGKTWHDLNKAREHSKRALRCALNDARHGSNVQRSVAAANLPLVRAVHQLVRAGSRSSKMGCGILACEARNF